MRNKIKIRMTRSTFWNERMPCWIRGWHCWDEVAGGVGCVDCGAREFYTNEFAA